MNTSDGLINLNVTDDKQTQLNIKTSISTGNDLINGKIYVFEVNRVVGERVTHQLTSVTPVDELPLDDRNTILRNFLPSAGMSLEELKMCIFNSINRIENAIIKEITLRLVEKYHDEFFIYPAASRMHHAYVGGLAYHSIGMLKLADGFIENYPYLRRDYLYAGIILHDIGKAIELTGIQGTEYTLDGQLLGHLVLGALEINKMAVKLGVEDKQEVRLLEHMLISHHGQPQFGAAKRPATPEALALWYIDTIDSKFRVLGEELDKTEPKEFTDAIGVLDRTKIYKI
jgi:3'-5' exoribonuclease